MNEYEANDSGDLYVLEESDIPGASLHGNKPCELNVVQLERWLSCRGAPVTGKKPKLIQRYGKELVYIMKVCYLVANCICILCRVECCIKFGWNHLLVDPDKDVNSQRKLSNLACEKMELKSVRLLKSLLKLDDPLWTKSLIDVPQISFDETFKFSVERKYQGR